MPQTRCTQVLAAQRSWAPEAALGSLYQKAQGRSLGLMNATSGWIVSFCRTKAGAVIL